MIDTPPSLTPPPAGYADWLADLKSRIHSAQQRATLAVNRELVLLYWQIGCDILARQAAQGWGAKVIERLAHDLRAAFPEMTGFSPRNLKYMRAFSEAWPDAEFVQACAHAHGSGLGLAIAREVAGRMDGRVDVASVPGATRFTLALPAAPPAAPPTVST